MRVQKVCLISDHHLCLNPRLWKEAFLYEKLGYQVVIITKWQSVDYKQRDLELLSGHRIDYKCFLNITPGVINDISRFYYRLRRRAASELQRFFKAGGEWAIGHAPYKLYKTALLENADLYVCHLESGFYAGRLLVKAGKKVSFDFEDWYSRDFLSAKRAVKLLERLEKFALENGIFCTAASNAMAKALKKVYPHAKTITVIYNSFPQESNQVKLPREVKEENPLKLIWTSRTVGPDRGLETLVDAIKQLQFPFELHLVGQCTQQYKTFLASLMHINPSQRLIFHNFISHDELMRKIASFDVGLAIENKEPDNKNKTVSNKILQYLQSGIKVLATDTDGQSEVAKYFPETVLLVKPGEPDEWKKQLMKLKAKREKSVKEDQLKKYTEVFSWSAQEEKLKQLIINKV